MNIINTRQVHIDNCPLCEIACRVKSDKITVLVRSFLCFDVTANISRNFDKIDEEVEKS